MFVMDSNFAPIVGQQVTLTSPNAAAAGSRISLLLSRAEQDECQVIAFYSKTGEGFLYSGGLFRRDSARRPALDDAQLRALATGESTITYTCVPKGNGVRLALDRDMNGVLNGDEHPGEREDN